MGEIIEIKDADGNIVRINLFGALVQIAEHLGKTMKSGDSSGVNANDTSIEITKK